MNHFWLINDLHVITLRNRCPLAAGKFKTVHLWALLKLTTPPLPSQRYLYIHLTSQRCSLSGEAFLLSSSTLQCVRGFVWLTCLPSFLPAFTPSRPLRDENNTFSHRSIWDSHLKHSSPLPPLPLGGFSSISALVMSSWISSVTADILPAAIVRQEWQETDRWQMVLQEKMIFNESVDTQVHLF